MSRKKNSYPAQRKIKEENRNKILKILLKSPKSFSELKRETNLSPMGLSKHLHELEKEGQIKIAIFHRKRVYQLTEKVSTEKLVIKSLMNYVGHFTVWRLLTGILRKEEEIHIEEYYKPKEFLMEFIRKKFNVTEIDFKALLEAFKEKYEEPIF